MRHLRRLGHCALAGLLAGALLGPLQLLLWPTLELTAGRAFLAFLAWSSWAAFWIGGAFFVIAEVAGLPNPYIALRPGFSLPLWRWLAAGALLLVALVAAWNYRLTKETLVQGHREALATAGVAAGLAGLALLAMALANRPTRGARLWAATLPAAAVVAVWSAWAGAPALPPPAAVTPPPFVAAHHVLLVSLEGADLPWLLPAIDRGDMPFLKERRDAGAWGQLRTVWPFSRDAALATLATGCRPSVHGVVGHQAYRLRWLSDRPVSLLLSGPWATPSQLPWRARERAGTPQPQTATVWEILGASGLPTGLVGWPGVQHARWEVPTPLASEAIPFSALEGDLRTALEPALLRRPDLAARTRAAFTVSAQTVAAAAIRGASEPVDAMVVDSDLPARLRPLWTGESGESGQEEVLRQALRLVDEQVRTLWSLMGGDEVILVVASPYGMAAPSPARRLANLLGGRRQWPVSAADSPDGFLLLSGPGVKPGTRLRSARLTDVTPTLLYLVDLPVSREMSGRVLLEGIDDDRASSSPLRLIPSYPVPARH